MKTNLDSLLQQEMQLTTGVAYLIPNKWWLDFCKANELIKDKQQLVYPPLNFQRYVDDFLLEYADSILAELEHKSNYLKISEIFISPQIKREYEWKIISSKMWHTIYGKLKQKFGVLTLYNQKQGSYNEEQNDIQIQIIFCSKLKSEAFVGFLPEKANVASAIRSIGFELGFIQMTNSRIMFPDKNPEKPYYFFEFESTPLNESQDTLFLAYNLQCLDQKDEKTPKADFSFGKDNMVDSNEANAGDMAVLGLQSFEQIRNDGTVSTGAQTPSFFGSEEQHRGQFRVRELFCQKKPQEIQEMRLKAKNIINSKLIGISQQTQDEMELSLQNVVQELVEYIHHHKKKTFKQKQLYHQ